MSANRPDLVLFAPGALPARSTPEGPAPAFPDTSKTWSANRSPQSHFVRAQVQAQGSIEIPAAGMTAAERWLLAFAKVAPGMRAQTFSAWTYGVSTPCVMLIPVHLHVGRDHLMLLDPTTLELEPGDAVSLAQAAAPVFDQPGEVLQAVDARHWFLTTPSRAPALHCCSWQLAMSRSIAPFLPTGADAIRWRKLVNEVQMLWFEHPVNVRREAAGLPAVNSVWLEGLGVPSPGLLALDVVSDQPCLRGLALAGGAQPQPAGAPLPNLREVLARRGRSTRPLLIDLDAWRLPALRGDTQAWQTAWQTFAQWCDAQRIRELVQASGLRCSIVFSNEAQWLEIALDRHPRWQFWRRLHLGEVLGMPAQREPRESAA